jgi:hypothetical protein
MRNLLILGSVFFLIGCGGGGGGDTVQAEVLPTGVEKMVMGQLYAVAPGDQVVKTSADAEIRVTHFANEINSTIELIEGTANIVRKQ